MPAEKRIAIASDADVVVARQLGRAFAAELGFGTADLTLIATAISEVARNIVAYAGRAIDGSEPRYRFPAGFHKSLELFNLHRVRGELSVVLVEGFFDCMKVTQSGFPCVALMGSTMSKTQEELLGEYFGEVIVMLDGDQVGRNATEEIKDRLQRVVYSLSTVDLPEGVQPDHLSSDEIRAFLNSA